MIKLTKSDLGNLIRGSSILATGGGGSISSATTLLNKLSSDPILVEMSECKNNDLIVTVFGVGGKEKNDPIKSSQQALTTFQKLFKRKIKAIIPVEIGPLSTMGAVFIAAENNIEILDADIVGFRSSPEVFLETISIPNLSREPSIIANDQGDVAILEKSQSIKQTEKFFRNFAEMSGGDAFVVGYPLTISQIKNVVGVGSITKSMEIGKDLQRLRKGKIQLNEFCKKQNFLFVGKGLIVKENKKVIGGFRTGILQIKNSIDEFEVTVKNENLVLKKNGELLVTVPDSICLMDEKTKIGVNNFENNLKKNVSILTKKAIPIWRTKKGRDLFSPKNLGLNINQKLL